MLKTVLAECSIRVMLLILTVTAAATAIYLAKPILAPAVFASVVGIVVSPVADRLSRIGIGRVVVAGSVLILSILLLAVLLLSLNPLLSNLAKQLPRIKYEIRGWVDRLSGLLQGLESISSEIEETVGSEAENAAAELPSVLDALWLAPNFGAQAFIFAGTLFFFVLSRNELYENAGRYGARLFRAERAVARYFAAVTLINAMLGVATALGLTLIGVSGALLWGLAAAMLNFILYLGPLIMLAGLTVAGLTQLGGAMAALPPLMFLMLNITEAQFVTPAFVGRQMDLNPLLVFLSIAFGLWIWGPVGAIVALPAVLWCRRVLERAPGEEEAAAAE
ncbi:AI-2E family transporter [Roseobacteraceae bacterium NS-SX3]